MLRAPRRRLAAAAAVVALGAAACGGDSSGLPDDPQAALTQAFANRAEDGFSATVGAEVSDAARERIAADDPTAGELLGALSDDPLVVSTDGEGRFGMALRFDGEPVLEIRGLQEAFYLRMDVEALARRFDPEGGGGVADMRGQLDQLEPLLGELTRLVRAAFDGRWVGVTGFSEEDARRLAEQFGGAPAEDASEAAAELGLLDLESFADRYLVVESADEGVYEVAVRLRALVEAGVQLSAATGQAMGAPSELAEVPEQVGGVLVTVEDEQVATVKADVAELAASAGEQASELQPDDLVLTASFDDPDDDLLEEPDDAETAPWSEVERLLTGMLGMLGGLQPDQQGA